MTTKTTCEAHLIVTHDGCLAALARGHGISSEEVQTISNEHFGADQLFVVSEHFLDKTRIKWCSRRDWSCDEDGEWHTHFFALKPNDNPDTHWTEIRQGVAARFVRDAPEV